MVHVGSQGPARDPERIPVAADLSYFHYRNPYEAVAARPTQAHRHPVRSEPTQFEAFDPSPSPSHVLKTNHWQ